MQKIIIKLSLTLIVFSANAIEFFKPTVNLDNSSAYNSNFTGSTSCGMTIETSNSSGAFYPQCSATNPNTEVAYYRLATLVGYENYVQEAAPVELAQDAINKFMAVISRARMRNDHQSKNCERAQDAVARSTSRPSIWDSTAGKVGWLPGVYKGWSKGKPVEYSGFVSGNAINSSNALARLVQASNAQPADRRMDLGSGRVGNELENAKAVSFMMTLDALFGQWDRYSGGNVQMTKKSNGEYVITIIDNGGAFLGSGTDWVSKSIRWHSRYDRKVIEKLREIHNFLNDGGEYLGTRTAAQFGEEILGLRPYYAQDIETQMTNFKRNLKLLLTAVNSNIQQFGESRVFFQ